MNNEVYFIHKVTLHCRFVVKHAEITFFSIKQTTYIVHSFVRHPFFIHSLSCSQLQIRFSCVGSERFMRSTKLGAKINFFSLAIINIVQTIICHIRASTIIEIEYQKCVSTLIRLHGVLTWEKLYEKFHRYRLVDWLQFWLWNFSRHEQDQTFFGSYQSANLTEIVKTIRWRWKQLTFSIEKPASSTI